MNIYINGQVYAISPLKKPGEKLHRQNLQQALKIFLNSQQASGTFAVALNGEFIDRYHYQQTTLNNNDKIDVLFPIQGG